MRRGTLPRRLAAVAALLALTGLSAACGGAAAPPRSAGAGPSPAATTTPATAAPASAPAVAPASAPAATPVTIQVPVAAGPFTDLYAGRDLGIFRRHGIALHIEVMNAPTGLAALETGSVQFTAGVGPALLAAAKGFGLRVVLVAMERAPFLLVAPDSVTSIAQLRGKRVALRAPEESITLIGRALLSQHGLPAGSYTYVNGGNPGGQIGLLQQGQAQAALLEIGPSETLLHKGYHVLASALSMQVPITGLVTSTKTLAAKRSLVQRVIVADIAAMHAVQSEPTAVEAVIARDFHVTPSEAKGIYQHVRNAYTLDGRPSSAAVQLGFRLTEQSLAAAHTHLSHPLTASATYDLSLLPQASGG